MICSFCACRFFQHIKCTEKVTKQQALRVPDPFFFDMMSNIQIRLKWLGGAVGLFVCPTFLFYHWPIKSSHSCQFLTQCFLLFSPLITLSHLHRPVTVYWTHTKQMSVEQQNWNTVLIEVSLLLLPYVKMEPIMWQLKSKCWYFLWFHTLYLGALTPLCEQVRALKLRSVQVSGPLGYC